MTTIIVCAFCLGYLLIALENVTKINKAAIALLMCVVCWALYAIGGTDGNTEMLNATIEKNLGEAGTTLFFLMGAMTIVEVVDQYGGFNFVRGLLYSKSKGALLWKIGFMTLLLSAVLDNLTTSIVMIMILRKLVSDHRDRIWYASMVIIAANAGGAFSPIGDVTTIMIWNGGMITASGVIREIFIPSLLAFVVPAFIVQYRLRGPLPATPSDSPQGGEKGEAATWQRNLIFFIGVGGLCSVPIYHNLTDLPAFMGILLVLGTLWFVTEVINWKKGEHDATAKRISRLLSRIDMTTILFFLGILMSVAVLSETGVLRAVGAWLEETIGNSYFVTGAIGILSSVVDNVPLVAGAMKMYSIPTAEMILADPALSQYAVDGVFWQLLSYCAGVGGSMLIIGSAAGVVVMGLENISFGWYMRHITPLAFAGYICGILAYYVQNLLLM